MQKEHSQPQTVGDCALIFDGWSCADWVQNAKALWANTVQPLHQPYNIGDIKGMIEAS